jgi:hypothetical protein
MTRAGDVVAIAIVGAAIAAPFAIGLWHAVGDAVRAYRLHQRMRPPF